MHSRFTRFAVGATVALALFSAVGVAQASSLTSTQVSAILSLLQSFGADQGTINSVSTVLGGSPSANTSCLNLSNNLTLGSSGSDVASLQNYLISKGDLTGTNATGYYGYLTASAVGQLQISLGIVSSQSDSAYGIMGPRTRAAIGCGNTAVTNPVQPTTPTQPTQPTNTSLFVSAAPISGVAPLTVSFDTNAQGTGYAIDFGDGTGVGVGIGDCGVTRDQDCGESHTYTSPGTYTAKLVQGVPNCDERGYGNACTVPSSASALNTASITVTNGSTSSVPTATINQSSLADTAGQITVSGTASGVAVIFQTPYGSTSAIPVVNGHWSTSVAITSPGSYPVSVKDYVAGDVLASGTLVVTIAPSTAFSATCSGTPYNSGTPGVSWAAAPSGGNGTYAYQWTLANDNTGTGISGTSADLRGQNLLATYGSTGTKSAIVVVSSGGQSATANCSTSISAPGATLTKITPSSGSTNTTITLYGTNLSSATEVDFYHSNGQLGWATPSSASNISISANSITITISGGAVGMAGPDTYQVKVVTPSGTSNAESFTLTVPSNLAPTLTSITPTSGSTNTVMTLYGTNLSGATEVDFYHSNGQLGATTPSSASNISISANSISITISGGMVGIAGPDTYQVKVVTPNGTSNAESFTLTQ
jgi:hypothetical protein